MARAALRPMNPMFTIFLFTMSLLAIAASGALLIYITNELRERRKADEKAIEENAATEAKQVGHLLSKMRAATLIGTSKPRKHRESEHDKN